MREFGSLKDGSKIALPLAVSVMHAGLFSVNRRRRAQNGTGAAAFGGVGREIHIPNFLKAFPSNLRSKFNSTLILTIS